MCVIIKGKIGDLENLDYRDYLSAWKHNPHGSGIIVYDDKKVLKIQRAMKFKDFNNQLNTIKKEYPKDISIVIHMRLATHGSIKEENTHPFSFDEKFYIIHNGVFGYYKNKNAALDKPDSYWKAENFYEKYIKKGLDLSNFSDNFLIRFFECETGNNRVVLLHKTKNGLIEKFFNFKEYKNLLVSNTYSFNTAFATCRSSYSVARLSFRKQSLF
ncbi:MAG: class II glutamine amidotransferase [Candidatus Aenigmatarchaeota archaeon]